MRHWDIEESAGAGESRIDTYQECFPGLARNYKNANDLNLPPRIGVGVPTYNRTPHSSRLGNNLQDLLSIVSTYDSK